MKRLLLFLAALAALTFAPGCSVTRNQQPGTDATQTDTQNIRRRVVRVSYINENQDIVNPGARAYLEQVDYTGDPGYTLTQVNKPEYATATDRPLPVTIEWDGTATSVEVSTDPLFTTTTTATPTTYTATTSPPDHLQPRPRPDLLLPRSRRQKHPQAGVRHPRRAVADDQYLRRVRASPARSL